MTNFQLTAITLMGMAVLLVACGGEQAQTESSPVAAYFPDRLESIDLVRNSSIDTYVGDSLYEYINGGAELYHLYDFELVSTASYSRGSGEVILDIFQFETHVGCFGLYSMLRPDEPTGVEFGAEGFSSSTSIDFVKARYLIRLTTFEAGEAGTENLNALAAALDKGMQVQDDPPELFAWSFPSSDMIPYTDKIHAEAFLGHQFLTDVYTRDFRINDEVVTLILAEDPDSVKLSEWKSIAGTSETAIEPFAAGEAALLQDDYYGDILAGRAGTFFIGVVNYKPELRQLLTDWLADWMNSMGC